MTVTKPKYQQVLDDLSQDILSGRYVPGQKFPSEAALTKRFGVSRITVAHAVRELQRRGVVDRVAGSGTFVRREPPPGPKSLLFGLVIPDLGETEIFEPICQAIAGSPGVENHALLWPHASLRASSKEEQALQLCEQCISRRVAGVFFAPVELSPRSVEVNDEVMRRFREAEIPVVLLDRRPEDRRRRERSDLVGIDNRRAGYLAADHLLRLGAKRLGFLCYEYQASTVKLRIAGYQEACGGPGQVFVVPADRPLELSDEARQCDGFVCANDRIAGRLMHTLIGLGVKIPRDVRIAGIDDVTYAELLPVPLTTIRQPCRELGEVALQLMLERLDRPRMPAREVLLDCELVVRSSCGG